MRRLPLFLPVLVVSIGLAGCGGDSGDSPLDNALGYLPEDTPFAVAVDTDLEGTQFKEAEEIVDKFPFGKQALESLREELEGENVDFEDDLRPLLGNELVIGSPDAKSFVSDEDTTFIGALQTKDEDKLNQLVEDQDSKEVGEKEGAKLYEDEDDPGDVFAVKDDVLIVGDSRETVEAALEQRKNDDRLTEDTFDEGLENLPEDALVRTYADVQGLLEADSSTEEARKVKWVDALRTLGATASVTNDGVEIEFNLATDSSDLSDDDVPIATGSQSPQVVELPGQIAVGLRDPSQIYDFGLATAKVLDPEGAQEFESDLQTIERRLDVDIRDDLLEQLDQDAVASVGIDGKFAFRGEVKDPAAVRRTMAKLSRTVPRVAQQLTGDRYFLGRSRGIYALGTAGGDTITFGVRGNSLEVSNDPTRADRVFRTDPESVSGAEGALVVTADTEQLAGRALRQFGLTAVLGGAILTEPLGELTGSVQADTDGIRGKLTQEVD